MKHIIDENVLIVANDVSRELAGQPLECEQADSACRLSAIMLLDECRKNGVVYLDDDGVILSLYRKRMSGSGQPGTGDAFFRYLSENQYNNDKVRRAKLTPHLGRGFDEFPDVAGLTNFDLSDRVFVALATVDNDAVIFNCVDSDYSMHAEELLEAGVQVSEICPKCLKRNL